MNMQNFGGNWTQEKLDRVKKYLTAYTKIFNKNPSAQFLNTIYVDAFAGSGYIKQKSKLDTNNHLFPDHNNKETREFIKGSVNIALEIEPPFDKYLFIDKNKLNTDQLKKLRLEKTQLSERIEIINEDANIYLRDWCCNVKWNKHRAVVFLDPYGMEVEWKLLQELADTQAIDLWILFPIGVAINRMFTKNEHPPENWSNMLTRLFGTDDWKEYFYRKSRQTNLFGDEATLIKDTDFEIISNYFVQRLKTIFHGVAENPLPLRNSRNVPIFLLCFAAGNPKGSSTAIKIAQDILKK